MTINHAEVYFFHFDTTPYQEKRPGVRLKATTGINAQLCLIELSAATQTRHVHDNEQIGYILSGKVTLTIGSFAETLCPGDGYRVPPNVEHGFSVSPDSKLEYVEAFCPPKEQNAL